MTREEVGSTPQYYNDTSKASTNYFQATFTRMNHSSPTPSEILNEVSKQELAVDLPVPARRAT